MRIRSIADVRCLLVNPRFRVASFWNFSDTCRQAGARYPAAPLGLITVAALLPQEWDIRLVDCNVQTWRSRELDDADLVLIGGMLPQQRDALDLIREAKAKGKTVVVGGPDATSSPHLYAEADHLVLGEAELTMPRFLADLERGAPQKMYVDPDRPDVTTSPCPRFDLLQLDRYLNVGVQWCRGCPFSCEFCDIIELYGRVPRAKTTEQMLHELQVLYDLGWRGHVDFVDDNFIGNKKLAKQFLPHLRTWLEERDWPFEFSTEASVNLADDDELMRLMQDCGFFYVFVGIESPDEETLIATRKRQNTKRSLKESIHKIYRHGMMVHAGFIIGFDTERGSVARGIIECVEETAIPVNMVGLLYALPNTQLTRRLAEEGRLPADNGIAPSGQGDQCTGGLNFEPLRPRAEIVGDYIRVLETIYEPERFYARVREVALALDTSKRRFKRGRGHALQAARSFLRFAWTLGVRRSGRRHFWRTICEVGRKNPGSLYQTVVLCALYIHVGPFADWVAQRMRASLEADASHAEPTAPAFATAAG